MAEVISWFSWKAFQNEVSIFQSETGFCVVSEVHGISMNVWNKESVNDKIGSVVHSFFLEVEIALVCACCVNTEVNHFNSLVGECRKCLFEKERGSFVVIGVFPKGERVSNGDDSKSGRVFFIRVFSLAANALGICGVGRVV